MDKNKKHFSLIRIENKIDVAELASVLRIERRDTAMEILSIIKLHCPVGYMWADYPAVKQIANIYDINLGLIK